MRKIFFILFLCVTALLYSPVVFAKEYTCKIRLEPATIKQGEEFTVKVSDIHSDLNAKEYSNITKKILLDGSEIFSKTDDRDSGKNYEVLIVNSKTVNTSPGNHSIEALFLFAFKSSPNEQNTSRCSKEIQVEFNPNITPGATAPGTTGDYGILKILKPLKLVPGNSIPQPYSPNPFDVKNINEGDTRAIDVYFLNIPEDNNRNPNNYTYYLCFKSNIDGCEDKNAPKEVKNDSEEARNNGTTYTDADEPVRSAFPSTSLVKVRVCGNGEKELKPWADCNNPENVQFYGGNLYRVSLYDKDKATQMADIPFYVRRFYPDVFLQIIPSTQEVQVAANEEAKQPTLESIILPSSKSPPIIKVTLSGRKRGNNNNNNYQLVLEGLNAQYKQTYCTVIEKTTDKSISKDFNRDGNNRSLGAGNYLLKINEQVDENTALNKCSGGFTYWHIQLNVDKDKNGNYLVKAAEVDRDPNGSDAEKEQKAFPTRPAPCANGFLDENSGVCSQVDTALGNIEVKPEKFIGRLFAFILSIAGVAALILLLISGYTLATSGGDKQKIAGAREQITSTIIGLLFIIFSLVILQVIGVDILRIPTLGR